MEFKGKKLLALAAHAFAKLTWDGAWEKAAKAGITDETLREILEVHSPFLRSPVVPFCPFSFWVRLLKPNIRKKGTLMIKGLLGNLGSYASSSCTTSGCLMAKGRNLGLTSDPFFLSD